MGTGAPKQPRRRGRPADHNGAATRAAVLVAAQRLFGARGYKGVSMEALAAECGVSPRALYYYFPSKRALFQAAAADALARFGTEVAERVFIRTALRDRIEGYIEVYRRVHASDPHLLPFVGVVLVDSFAEDPQGTHRPPSEAGEAGEALRGFLETLVDDALAGHELEPGVDRDGALLLLLAMGMGMALASIGHTGSFPAMLDVLQRLNEGTLYRSPPRAGPPDARSPDARPLTARSPDARPAAARSAEAGRAGARSAATGGDTTISSPDTGPPSRGDT